MFDLVETYRANLDYPVELVRRSPSLFPPLVRAADSYAHRSHFLAEPFELIRHRTKTYALVALDTGPYGWLSRIASAPNKGHSARQNFRVWGAYDVEVMTLALAPGSVLIVDATRFAQGHIDIGLRRYIYQHSVDSSL